MNKIGIPDDNMAFADAGRIKALISQEKYFYLRQFQNNNFNYELSMYKKNYYIVINFSLRYILSVANILPFMKVLKEIYSCLLDISERLHIKTLNISLRILGENAMLTAKSYCCLGRHYESEENYTVQFFLFY